MNEKELEFTVFCIESVAEYLELKGDEIYKEMRDGISDMHCRSDKYLAEDLLNEYALIISG